jgi:adenine-specific DNA-methyltransferase
MTVSPEPRGRLELTWTNKHLALLRNEDRTYEWVPPSDFRVAEVRLLRDAGATGEVHHERDRSKDNLLIRGDALNGLGSLIELPEFAREYLGRVKLAYIDPPFNTGEAFAQYEDNLEHSIWLTMMRDRLRQIEKLLAPDGSVWVHLNDDEVHYAKVVMDEVFGRRNFVASIVWQKRTSRENRAAFGSAHDYILVYSPAGPTGWRDVRNRLMRNSAKPTNPDNDPRGPWVSQPFSAQGFRKNQMYDIVTPTGVVHQPPKGRCWAATEPEYLRLRDVEKRIYFPRGGNGRPRVKEFEPDLKPLVPMTWWPAAEVGDTEESKKEILDLFPDVDPFDTPKPERLMERIIHIATNPGEIVLDCFAGSGSTAAVAHKTGRRWVAVESERDTLETFTGPRLEKVVAGDDPGGITEQVSWEGGGGFRVLDIAPSMFTVDGKIVFLADWAVGGALHETTAAQLGFEYEEEPPFCGRKGRSRLAVIDGLVNRDVAALLVGALGETERLVLCATAVDPDTREALRKLRSGSTVRKIPASILADYKRTHIWWPRAERIGAEPQQTTTKEAQNEALTA